MGHPLVDEQEGPDKGKRILAPWGPSAHVYVRPVLFSRSLPSTMGKLPWGGGGRGW